MLRTILIVTYIIIVLLISGLAKSDALNLESSHAKTPYSHDTSKTKIAR